MSETELLKAILDDHDENLERRFRREHPVLWGATLLGPLLLTAGLLFVIGAVAGWQYLKKLVIMACVSLWLFGRFVILGGTDADVASVAGSMSAYELFAMVLYLDVAVAMVLAFHLGFLFRLPYFGEKLQALTIDGRFILNHQRWIRRATFAGLVTFVAFPLAATGSVGGSIFGRLLGLSRGMTFMGIVMGSLIGDGVMLLAADFVGTHLNKNNPAIKYGGLAVVIGLILLLEWRYRKLRDQFADAETNSNGDPGAS